MLDSKHNWLFGESSLAIVILVYLDYIILAFFYFDKTSDVLL